MCVCVCVCVCILLVLFLWRNLTNTIAKLGKNAIGRKGRKHGAKIFCFY